MSPSEALIAKNLHFNAIKTLTEQFGGRVVDVGENDCIVQISAKSVRVNAFLNLMRTFGVIEAARSGESGGQILLSSPPKYSTLPKPLGFLFTLPLQERFTDANLQV